MIAIIDYNTGNLGSIRNMLKRVGVVAEITADPHRIDTAEQLILPGVGAFDSGMENLERSGLIPLLNQRVLEAKVPTLGICLGMQLMTNNSAEGARSGLGWMDAETRRFLPTAAAPKVPHMGWSPARSVRSSPLTDELPPDPRFYFVHSFYVSCRVPDDALLKSTYGIEFDSGFQRENIFGVQFHPEKSHRYGMQLLRNFAERCRGC